MRRVAAAAVALAVRAGAGRTRVSRTLVARTLGAGALVAGAIAGGAPSCARPAPAPPPLFERLSAERTGVRFENRISDSTDFNILTYLYYYNGGGVAVGDVDGDGRQDLYFSSNLGPNRLYRNLGDFRFEDVTERAGVAGPPGWKTGVTMVDVDGDGHLDIHASAVSHLTMQGRNVLYVNDGDGTFTDRTAEYGLEHVGYATQAAFLDYDRDGDLDVYLLSHSTHTERAIGQRAPALGGAALPIARNPRSDDRLLRHDRGPDGRPRFVDVSAEAGLLANDGFGLGVVASDVNADGCPDLYVANDFQEDDLLYLNRCDGTFAEVLGAAAPHTSRFAMGVDAGDVNGDGRSDLFVADMLPEREDVLKTSASTESFALFNLRLRAGYRPQYARNTLQLNRGVVGDSAGAVPRFSDVGYLAGVHASDWSWAPLFADLDLDGRVDLFVTNGIWRRPNDLDYINYVGNDAAQAALARGDAAGTLDVLRRMPQVALPNHAFRNAGDLRFTDVAEAWGLAQPGFSNGAAYVDLDDDGALDLVVNTLNAPAAVYRSHARARTGHGHLTVRLRGAGRNSAGFGARVTVVAGGARQTREQAPTRGFLSSVDPRLHFGLGRLAQVDSLLVTWPDGRVQALARVAANRTVTLAQDDATAPAGPAAPSPSAGAAGAPLLTDASAGAGLDWRHLENDVLDTDREPLMPHLLSREGPALATGDVDGDGRDDVFVGGAKWQPARLWRQQGDGRFAPLADAALAADSLGEDVDAAFFDADGDRDLDLYVVTAGNEFWGDAPALLDRLYLNDGRGRFRRADDGALPPLTENGSCVVPGDYDGDGDVDLFVGARVVSRQYGVAPRSALLENDGTGRFTDVTARVAPMLERLGMVTAAVWTDRDGDGRPELVVVGEWMPVTVLAFERGRLVDRTRAAGLAGTEGWWNHVAAADLDGDGRDDLVLGNLGLNAWVKASAEEPARLHVHDFGGNGTIEQILTFHRQGKHHPLAGRDDLVKLVPTLRSRFPSYASFGARTIDEIFPADELRRATVREARTMASAVALLEAGGRYRLQALPTEAQLAPIYASIATDLDGDGRVDLLVGGNQRGVPPVLGRHDASYGLVLRGLGGGRFAPVEMAASGVHLAGDVRRMRLVRGGSASGGDGGVARVVVARNDDALVLLRARGDGARATTGAATLAARGARSPRAR